MPTDAAAPSAAPSAKALGKAAGDLRTGALMVAIGLQAFSTVFFVFVLWGEVLGLRRNPVPWYWQEWLEIFASLGLILGLGFTVAYLRYSFRRTADMTRAIDAASGRYQMHVDALFDRWGLSPSERAVAIYAMKGFSNAEIAGFRNTSVATVKSQMNAVFRKGDVENRQQLIAYLVDEFLAGTDPAPG